tara:strand:- start:1369 stop:1590 length:222 start_codon:yes stop_codon:yes gene_type:complete
MNLSAKIDGNKLIIFNLVNGSTHKVITLPTNAKYSGPIISGDIVTVSLHINDGTNRSRSYNLKSGSQISDILM